MALSKCVHQGADFSLFSTVPRDFLFKGGYLPVQTSPRSLLGVWAKGKPIPTLVHMASVPVCDTSDDGSDDSNDSHFTECDVYRHLLRIPGFTTTDLENVQRAFQTGFDESLMDDSPVSFYGDTYQKCLQYANEGIPKVKSKQTSHEFKRAYKAATQRSKACPYVLVVLTDRATPMYLLQCNPTRPNRYGR